MEDPFPRTRILSTSDVAVLCIFYLGWVCWQGVYLLFLQLSALPERLFSSGGNVMTKKRSHSRVTTWRSLSVSTRND